MAIHHKIYTNCITALGVTNRILAIICRKIQIAQVYKGNIICNALVMGKWGSSLESCSVLREKTKQETFRGKETDRMTFETVVEKSPPIIELLVPKESVKLNIENVCILSRTTVYG